MKADTANASRVSTPVAPDLQDVHARTHPRKDNLRVDRKYLDRKRPTDIECEIGEGQKCEGSCVGGSIAEGGMLVTELDKGVKQGLVGRAIYQTPEDHVARSTAGHCTRRWGVVDGDMRRMDKLGQPDGELTAITREEAARLGTVAFLEQVVWFASRIFYWRR